MFNSPVRPASKLGPIGRKTLLSLALAALMSALSIAPAWADRDGERGRGDRHGEQWRGDCDHRDHRDHRDDRYRNQRMYRPPHMYAQPVYVPPPVYYEPRQSPGISLFFPLDLRR